MIGETEAALVALIRESPLGRYLREVATLPDLPTQDVLNRWRTDAPAVYVVALDGEIGDVDVTVSFALVAVASNAATLDSARRGDGVTIGLYQIMEQLVAHVHGARMAAGGAWYCGKYSFLQEPALREQGLFAALLQVTGKADIPEPDISGLADLKELYASWGVVPQEEQKGKPLCEALITLNPGGERHE